MLGAIIGMGIGSAIVRIVVGLPPVAVRGPVQMTTSIVGTAVEIDGKSVGDKVGKETKE